MDALDERLAMAGWTEGMVVYWTVLRRHGWSPIEAMRKVQRDLAVAS